MSRALFLDQLKADGLTLLVSLPTNSADLARAAVAGGADGLKVHINVHHHASGTHFGTLAEESANLEAIIAAAQGRPVGIVPGGEQMASLDDMRRLDAMGIDFFDAYAHHMPAWMVRAPDLDMAAMVALGHQHDWGEVHAVGAQLAAEPTPWVDAVEASVVEPEGYGEALNTLDLARYRRLCETVCVPVMVPTQRAVAPDEVGLIADCGAAALLIGAIVTGRQPHTIEAATGDFRRAIDAL
ncbi:MAG: hypothetical protein ACE5R4_04520 [Armatimonadota bacterium]